MEAGIASVVAVQPDKTRIEIGLIGREGMSGTRRSAGRRSIAAFHLHAGRRGRATDRGQGLTQGHGCECSLAQPAAQIVQVFMVQTAHTAIANARAHIDKRLARWILMAQIVVRNRKGLEQAAGKSYGVPEKNIGGSLARLSAGKQPFGFRENNCVLCTVTHQNLSGGVYVLFDNASGVRDPPWPQSMNTDNLRTNVFDGPLRLKRKTTEKPSLNWPVIGP